MWYLSELKVGENYAKKNSTSKVWSYLVYKGEAIYYCWYICWWWHDSGSPLTFWTHSSQVLYWFEGQEGRLNLFFLVQFGFMKPKGEKKIKKIGRYVTLWTQLAKLSVQEDDQCSYQTHHHHHHYPMHFVITNPEVTRTPGDRLHSTAAERASSSQLLMICVHELGRAAGLKQIPDSSS
jgi:hypothetical protein